MKRFFVFPEGEITDMVTVTKKLCALASSDDIVYASEKFAPVALWMTVGIVAALFVAGLILFFTNKNVFFKYVKIAGVCAVIYAAALGITMLALEIAKNYSQSYADESGFARDTVISNILIPVIIVCAVVIVSTLAISLVYKFRSAALRPTIAVCGTLLLASVIVSAILIGLYYTANISDDGYYNSDTASVNTPLLIICTVCLIAVAATGAFLFDKGSAKGFDTRTIAAAAICVAFSFALSFIKVFDMPQGGAITLVSLLPLLVFSYIYGTKKGVFVGVLYGLLQAIQDPFIIHPAQFLLDYPIAFSFVGFGGMFAHVKALDKVPQVKFLLGALVAGAGRYISHVLSGVFAFSAYAGDTPIWIYSLTYNTFVLVDIAIAIAVGVVVFSSKTFMRYVVLPYGTNRTRSRAGSDQSTDGSVTAESDGLAHTDTSAESDKRA